MFPKEKTPFRNIQASFLRAEYFTWSQPKLFRLLSCFQLLGTFLPSRWDSICRYHHVSAPTPPRCTSAKSSMFFCRPHQPRVSRRGMILGVRSRAVVTIHPPIDWVGQLGQWRGGHPIKHFYRKSGLAAPIPTRNVCVICCWQSEV